MYRKQVFLYLLDLIHTELKCLLKGKEVKYVMSWMFGAMIVSPACFPDLEVNMS